MASPLDKLAVENNQGQIIADLKANVQSLQTKNTVADSGDEIFGDLGDVNQRYYDTNGIIRFAQSLTSLLDELSVNANWAWFSQSGSPTMWIDADTGIVNLTQVNFNGTTLLESLVQLLQLGYIVSQTVTANSKTRTFRMGMKDNGSYAEGRIEFNEPAAAGVTVPNGDFASLDMTSWTQDVGVWDASSGQAVDYHPANPAENPQIHSTRAAVTAGTTYTFSAKSSGIFWNTVPKATITGTITIRADFYNASSGGSLISSETIASRTGSSLGATTSTKDIVVPVGATYIEYVALATVSGNNRVTSIMFDDFAIVAVAHTSALIFRDVGLYYLPFGSTTETLVAGPGVSGGIGGIDAYVVAMLHFNTDLTDVLGNTWTAFGNAAITAAQLKYGAGSLVLDGTGDYLTTPDSARWQLDDGSNANKWTVDFWLRFNVDPGTNIVGLLMQWKDDSNLWAIRVQNNLLDFLVRSGGSNIVSVTGAFNPASATWYHIAIVKNGTSGYMLFVDGTQVGTTTTDTDVIPDLNALLTIGDFYYASTHYYLNGWIDELRISKGVARWTGPFTPPTSEYTA